MDNPLVSVLMTSYNREKYIGFAIESVLASTYKNWELIIVDDGSKDRTVSIAESYAKDGRIKVFVNEQNLGDYLNRNRAAELANGKYFKYLDSDDLIYPHGLEQLVWAMESFPEAGYGLCSLDQDEGNIYPFQLTPLEAYQRHYLKTSLFHKAPLSSIIRKDAFHSVGGFSGKQHLGDFELWHLLSRKFNVVLIQQGIVWHREHEDQQMQDNRTDPYVPFKYILLSSQMLQNPDCPLKGVEKEKAILSIKRKEARFILSTLKHFSLEEGLRLFKSSPLSALDVLRFGLKK